MEAEPAEDFVAALAPVALWARRGEVWGGGGAAPAAGFDVVEGAGAFYAAVGAAVLPGLEDVIAELTFGITLVE